MTTMFKGRRYLSRRGADQAPKGSLARFLVYAADVWHLLAALSACMIAGSLLELAIPWVMGFTLLDTVIKRADASRLPLVVVLLVGIFLAQKFFSFFQTYFQELANQRVVHRLRCDLYEHISRLPLRSFDRHQTGDLLSRVTGDVDTIESVFGTFIQNVATQFVMFVATLLFLFAVNPTLTAFVLPTIPALGLSAFFVKRTIKKRSRLLRDLAGQMAALAGEAMSGIRIVKTFRGERFETRRFSARSLELLWAHVKIVRMQSLYSSTVDAFVLAGTIIVILTATPWVFAGSFSVGALVAYLSYLGKLYSPAKELSKLNFHVQKLLAAADRIFEVMDDPREDASAAEGPRSRAGEAPLLTRISGAVCFDNVTFGYDPDRPVLKRFSLSVAAGEMVALVGHSGGGKTTVVSLLLRLYRPTSGEILIDRVPIDQIPLRTLRRQIGLVPQETFLFSGTLRDNIAYAYPRATEEQIVEAARAAYAHDFIMQLPAGYSTQAGERGVKLSGGQRQRIAIARALLRNPRILIFDEATSHLDSESEQYVQQALEKVARGRTVLVIAHRLSTVCRADRTVVLEEGEIAQVGKHVELLARDGLYRRLYALQLNSLDAVEFQK